MQVPKNRWLRILLCIIMLMIPIALWILPKTAFDHGPTTCVYTLVTGTNCMGCGMTRACMRLIHFDILGALEFNRLSILVFPILAFFYAKYFLELIGHWIRLPYIHSKKNG